jgi:glycerol-3-phosphate cytidylyltransferase
VIVYTVGTFDLLHVGHLALLEYCKSLGNVLAVGVAANSLVKSYKPHEPIIPLAQRMEMLRALRCVDIVIPYHELEYVSGCKKVNADIFVIGEDWGKKQHNLDVEAYLKVEGKQLVQVRYNPRTSSSKIKKNVITQSHNDKYSAQAVAITIHNKGLHTDSPDISAPLVIPTLS